MNTSTPAQVPASALPKRPPRELLALARHGLDEAAATKPAGPRYATAHLSALRCAAAVLAARARPSSESRRPRTRPTSVWVLLPQVAPELGEWASFFGAAALKRAAAEAGLPNAVTDREADEMVADAEVFYRSAALTCGLSTEECR